MTVVVGVLCSDGVVIGSDSSATFAAGGGSFRTIEQECKKVEIVQDKVILSGTGQIGLGQRFCEIVDSYWKNKNYDGKTHIQIGRDLCRRAIEDFNFTYGIGEKGVVQYGALLAFPHTDSFYLCEFTEGNLQPEFKTTSLWYVSMGSGQLITDPFLGFIRKIFWGNNLPKLQDGIFATTWALSHAIELNPGGINGPLQLAVLRKNGTNSEVKVLENSEIEEHVNNTKELEKHISDYKTRFGDGETKEIPKFEAEAVETNSTLPAAPVSSDTPSPT